MIIPSDSKTSIIISDTSCLIALTNIKLLDVLKHLYNVVLVTPEVAHEYRESLPDWITIKAVENSKKINDYNKYLDLGESSAIALAMEITDAVLIIDDKEARKFASNLGLRITGILGILIRAVKKGIIPDITDAIFKLQEVGFHLPANIKDYI